LSAGDHPAHAAHRRRFYVGFGILLSCLMVAGGIRMLLVGETWAWRIVGMALGLLGAPGVYLAARRLWRLAIGYWRFRRDRCFHCGYPIAGTRVGSCPECGGEPFGL
jgi:hypothetical protein